MSYRKERKSCLWEQDDPLGLPLFVFPTQPHLTRAISTRSHLQGPLSANFPLLMIHSSEKGTMFAYVLPAAHGITSTFRFLFARRLLKILTPPPPPLSLFPQQVEEFSFLSHSHISFFILSSSFLLFSHFFVFVPVKNVFSAACGNNQITYSH